MKLKLVAIAAAILSMAGVAQADIVTTGTQNGSLYLYAFDTVSRNWYVRDLGYTINSFLPSSVTTLAGDGSITGDKTPTTGLTLDKVSNPGNFADATFSSFVAANTLANIRWAVGAIDDQFNGTTAATSTNRVRVITSSSNGAQTAVNSTLDNYVGTGRAGGLGGATSPFTLSTTRAGASAEFDTNFLFGANSLTSLDSSASLFYFQRTRGTLGSTETPQTTKYGNASGFATVTLAQNGDFTYQLNGDAPSPVPLPAAAWLMGAGLIGLGGVLRRRKDGTKA